MSLPDPDNDPYCPGCGDQVPDGDLVSLTGYPDLCAVCADEACKHPTAQLWDHYGAPRLPHVPCPKCGESASVVSHFDEAWCFSPGCDWRGSLTEMRLRSARPKARRAATADDGRITGEYQHVSLGYRRQPYGFWDRVAVVGVTALCVLAVSIVAASFWWSRR